MAFPDHRYRRLRKTKAIRDLVAETSLSAKDLMVPLFIMEGIGQKDEIVSMPGYYRFSLDLAIKEVEKCLKLGLHAFLLFVKVNNNLKDNLGTEALKANGLLPRAIREIKRMAPETVLFSDIALDPFSSFGHDGIVEGENILNDPSIEILSQMAVIHAEAGVDFVAPSDMMDGRIGAIRNSLDSNSFQNVGIMSYAAKYSSSFYGPFRDALDSAPGLGDKSTYQMDYRNSDEAIKECQADLEEGADILMIKPALPYLDIVAKAKDKMTVPIAAYQVSGEYSMIMAAGTKGYIDQEAAMQESLFAIKRAGADIIASYFAKSYAKKLQSIGF